jgi:hypothetical protein
LNYIYGVNLRRITQILGFIFWMSTILCAQTTDRYENPDNQEQQSYDSELVYGVNWNTNGGLIGGLMTRYAWQLKKNQLQYHLLGIEAVHVTSRKETTVASDVTGLAYIYQKTGNFFSIRPHYGIEFILFPKAEEEGVQVSCLWSGGLSLGLFVPYYVITDYIKNESKPYAQVIDLGSAQNIYGSAGFTKGLDSTKPYLGLHSRASMNFEYGLSDSVAGIEVGVLGELFGSEISILPKTTEGSAFFLTFFITAYFGIK